jgi:lysozyme
LVEVQSEKRSLKTYDIEQIKEDEGFRTYPYKCTADKLTIGYGWNLDAGIPEKYAKVILSLQLQDNYLELIKVKPFVRDLPEEAQAILSNMQFNLGPTRLLKFKNMWAALAAGDYIKASKEMLDSKWARQVPNRAGRLAERMKKLQYI